VCERRAGVENASERVGFSYVIFIISVFLPPLRTLLGFDTCDATQSLIGRILVPSSIENNSEQTMRTDKSGK